MKIVREGNSITSIRADPAARIAARRLNWIWTHLLASRLQTVAIANDATSFGLAHVEMQERIMVAIGDIVERVGGRSKFTTGRVTGFTPNGMVRVRVSPFEDRFWPQCQTKVTLSGELVVLRRRLERWIDSCGGMDEAMKVARLLFPDNPTYR